MSKRLSIIFKRNQEAKCSKTNYSPQGYWHQKARRRGKVSDDAAKKQLIKQVIWQINLVAAKHIPRPKFDVSRQIQFTKQILFYHMTLRGVVGGEKHTKTI